MQVIGKAVSSDELTKREKSRGLRKNRSPEEEEEERASERWGVASPNRDLEGVLGKIGGEAAKSVLLPQTPKAWRDSRGGE